MDPCATAAQRGFREEEKSIANRFLEQFFAEAQRLALLARLALLLVCSGIKPSKTRSYENDTTE